MKDIMSTKCVDESCPIVQRCGVSRDGLPMIGSEHWPLGTWPLSPEQVEKLGKKVFHEGKSCRGRVIHEEWGSMFDSCNPAQSRVNANVTRKNNSISTPTKKKASRAKKSTMTTTTTTTKKKNSNSNSM